MKLAKTIRRHGGGILSQNVKFNRGKTPQESSFSTNLERKGQDDVQDKKNARKSAY